MTDTRAEVDAAYAAIAKSEARLAELRAACPHTNCRIGNYSYRIGNVQPVRLCSDCDRVVGALSYEEYTAWAGKEPVSAVSTTTTKVSYGS